MKEFGEKIKDKRRKYGVTQEQLAIATGFSREYINRVEKLKTQAIATHKEIIVNELEKFNPNTPLTMLFDYVRIRFPTTDVNEIAKDVMQMKIDYFVHEEYGFYSYDEHYVLGDIFLLVSGDEEKGVLVELKGRGCRQFEGALEAQGRTWYEFFHDCLMKGGVMKRLDLAINDMAGMLDIPYLTEKCRSEECVSVFRHFKSYRSGELHKKDEKVGMGYTLYIGSLQSEVYFCLYEKDYEQYVKFDIPLDEVLIKNRFEIRLKNERAYLALEDLLSYRDAERTAFSIINRYVKFVVKDEAEERKKWKLDSKWEWFVGSNRNKLRLTTKPEPYTIERTMKWLSRQVAPTLRMVQKLGEIQQTDYVNEMISHAQLTDKQQKIIEQQKLNIDEIIEKKGGESI